MLFFFFSLLAKAKIFHTGTAFHQTITFNKHKEMKKLKEISSSFEGWYYVYVDSKEPLKYLQTKYSIEASNDHKITSRTFLLYLNSHELSRLSKDSLIELRSLEQTEKYIRKSTTHSSNRLKPEKLIKHKLAKTNQRTMNKTIKYFVFISEKNSLPTSKYYQVESKLMKNCYLISIMNEDGSEEKTKEELSSLPYVQMFSQCDELHLKNIFGTGFTQKNTRKPKLLPDTKQEYFERYINDQGITGKGEVVTVVDTLIDINHDMFYDPNVSIQFDDVNIDHRKIIYYDCKSIDEYQSMIGIREHGTHVAGIIAGQSICDNSYLQANNGIAPDAKLIYISDQGIHKQNLITQSIIMNSLNSSISSNSWGSIDYYPIFNWIYGNSYQYNDLIFIMAGGNERQILDENCEYFSINDPGGNKNVLAVGAIDSLTYTINKVIMKDMDRELPSINLQFLEEHYPKGTLDLLKLDREDLFINQNVLLTEDADVACSILYIPERYIVIYYGKTELKCHKYNGYIFTTSDERVIHYSESNKRIYLWTERYLNQSVEYIDADYSSVGPGYKGIIKPDVVSPGTNIISALSSENSFDFYGCPDDGFLHVTSGTSMATPNVAGATALINQYFKEKRNLQLNGADLRALIIASASRPDERKEPDMFIGHGIVDLSTILNFDKSFGVGITQKDSYIENSNHVMTKINVKNNETEFRIVLSYFDIELNIESMIPIMNDLDLVVISPSGKRYLGDHRTDEDSEHFSTNEKVIISKKELEIGEYEIHVYSNIDEVQKFSIVSVGPIDDQLLTFQETLECGCDQCTKHGKCKCDSLHVGNHCQTEIIEMTDSESKIQILHNSIKRIYLNFKTIDSITIKRPDSYKGFYSNVWLGRKCHSALSDYETYLGLDNLATNITLESNESLCIAIFNNHFNDQEYIIQVIGENIDIETNSSSITSNQSDENENEKDKEIKKLRLGIILTGTILGVIIILLVVLFIVIFIIRQKRDSGTTQQGYQP
ncbi:hypothetical protein TRFO_27076 [Tritrichomonas foetus]|uniref:Peptidase S8/S53 domain-containing protein n=1 Tax=Tritrichomonas foetus TaxID=1144522 RepID=A0A1J4K1E8_9EUKA|nr:hypothetical protein TRFO_27076 [Tritrichomonas foetus]|eukprot:OHT05257.1 hypothetical protein TRFO_27076 [Tritrichomonas foetus]